MPMNEIAKAAERYRRARKALEDSGATAQRLRDELKALDDGCHAINDEYCEAQQALWKLMMDYVDAEPAREDIA